jgi:hypothetical protein
MALPGHPIAAELVTAALDAWRTLHHGERGLPAFAERGLAIYLEIEDPGPGQWDPGEDTATYREVARSSAIWGYSDGLAGQSARPTATNADQ